MQKIPSVFLSLLVLAVIAVSGCSLLAPQAPRNINSQAIGEQGDLYAIPANLRTLDIRRKDADYIVCSEPVPDIAMSNALQLAINATQDQAAVAGSNDRDGGASVNISNMLGLGGSAQASTMALELAGRTQIVLLAREFIASNCKARANAWISNAEFKQSQDAILNQIVAIIRTEQERAEADKANAEAVKAAISAELNETALSNVRNAVNQNKRQVCFSQYDRCIQNAEGSQTIIDACRSRLLECGN